MEASLGPLLPLFARERAAGRALALGILVHTDGSTYRKPGALILIAADGEYAGLISGGCLEGDLREHARAVISDGQARSVRYDMRSADDLVWGLGLGCEGAMQILLLRADRANEWQPLTHLERALKAHQRTAVGVVVESQRTDLPLGSLALPTGAAAPLATTDVQAALARAAARGDAQWLDAGTWRLFLLPLSLPPRILLLGAGPDAVPVVDLATRLGWKLTLADHRPAYAVAAHFPSAERVLLADPEELAPQLDLESYTGAVVMSHHLPSDLAYLRLLATSSVRYIGLLGPAVRRERLLQELAAQRQLLEGRLYAPVGLRLGGRTPESIALAIVAELHAFVHSDEAGALRRAGSGRSLGF
jgi:xanthine dehydrogenase accessory factor